MTKGKTFTLVLNGVTYKGVLAPIEMDVYNNHCVKCGSEHVAHIADLIQHGWITDVARSMFSCTDCGHTFYFKYDCIARDSAEYWPTNMEVRNE